MKGLLTKEWYVIWKNGKFNLLLALVFMFIGIMSENSFWMMYGALFVSILPMNFMSLDEISKWEQYSLSMPYKRSTIVSAKYIISLMFSLGASAIAAIALCIRMMRTGGIESGMLAAIILPTVLVGLMLPTLVFPLNFKFGTSKGRMLMVIMACMIAGILSNSITAIVEGDELAWLGGLFRRVDIYGIVAIAIAVIAVLFALSWLSSIKIFEKKDM